MTMAYTYGNYEMKYLAENESEIQESRGIFHTVWKKQKDGTWKYVYDWWENQIVSYVKLRDIEVGNGRSPARQPQASL